MRRGSLPVGAGDGAHAVGQEGAHVRQAGLERGASATARTSRLPTITPSAISPTAATCSGVPTPKPTATGTSAAARTRSTTSPSSGGSAVRSPVTPVTETTYTNPRARLRDPPHLVGRRRRGDERHQRDARLVAGGAQLAGLGGRHVGHDQARRRRASASASRDGSKPRASSGFA